MSRALLELAALSVSQEVPPAPPPPPPVKSGSFACDVFDPEGAKLHLTGELGNWRQLPNGRSLADLRLAGPRGSDLSFVAPVSTQGPQIKISRYDAENGTSLQATMDASRFDRTSRIMIEILGKFSLRRVYVGFCQSQFSTDSRKIDL
jgi:hypothetical protein